MSKKRRKKKRKKHQKTKSQLPIIKSSSTTNKMKSEVLTIASALPRSTNATPESLSFKTRVHSHLAKQLHSWVLIGVWGGFSGWFFALASAFLGREQNVEFWPWLAILACCFLLGFLGLWVVRLVLSQSKKLHFSKVSWFFVLLFFLFLMFAPWLLMLKAWGRWDNLFSLVGKLFCFYMLPILGGAFWLKQQGQDPSLF